MICIILVATFFIIEDMKENVCLNSVKKVNSFLNRNGFSKLTDSCQKLSVQSKEECNEYDQKMSNKFTDINLERELDNCETYINNTKVNFHLEEKETPLAFSILTHKDAVQLSRFESKYTEKISGF